ncbi:unnamed protein product, partial [Heterosigma akashiwo]
PRTDKEGNYLGIERDRICLNMSWVNEFLEDFSHPLPKIADILDDLTQFKYYTELDLANAFNQVKVCPELSDLLTFTTSFGKVSYLVLPYGVKFATDAFQYAVEHHFWDCLRKILSIYVDNMLVHSNTRKQHLADLRTVFQRCEEGNLKLRLDKCSFGKTSLRTLGFIVEQGKISVDPAKLEILKKAPVPVNPKELQSFLGLANYFRTYIPFLAHASAPLYAQASKKEADFRWTEIEQNAYDQVKALLERELMIHALVDDEPIEVFVDASKVAIAGVIIQDGKLISSVSRTLTKAERKHHIIELEALAIRYSLQKMKHFLHGREFTVFTDHKPLLGIWKKAALIENIRLLSSVLAVTEYQFEMKHIEGEKNVLADFGSRQIDSSQYPTAEELSGMDDFLDTIFAPLDGVLYVTHRGERLIYVPSKLRQAFFHCIHTGKHMGVTEMCATTKQLGYYFPLMQNKYLEFLSSCPCAGAKDYRTGLRKYKGKGITATRPMDLVALDLYMYDSINYLVMVDVYSRFPFCYPLLNKTMEEVNRSYTKWTSIFGEPSTILVDNGNEFNAITTQKQKTPVYHPQANGVVER